MNIDTIEMDAIAKVAKAEEAFEMLALSIDELDLVGGGAETIGALG